MVIFAYAVNKAIPRPAARGLTGEIYNFIYTGDHYARSLRELREQFPDRQPTVRSNVRFLVSKGILIPVPIPAPALGDER